MEDSKKDIDRNTLVLGDFNTSLSKMATASKQKINKGIVSLNNILDQMSITNIYTHIYISYAHLYIYITFHPKEAKYTFLSNARGTLSKIEHMIGHKTSLNKFKKIEIISSIFSKYKGLKLETNLKEKTQKHSNS